MLNIMSESDLHCYLPPEWAPQSGVMITWPHAETIWAETLDDIDQVLASVAYHVTRQEKLVISCYDQNHVRHIQALLLNADARLDQVSMHISPCDDIWVRDHGPISVFHQRHHEPLLLDFLFNGWGNKYPHANDNEITRSIHAQHAFGGTLLQSINMVLEGGAIEVDGKGTLLTTSSCLLSKSRNAHLTKEAIEHNLRQLLGVERILWLDHGYLAGDDTDGHIDTLARFTDPHTICYIRCNDPNDEHYSALKKMEEQLRTFTDFQGNPYRLVPLPWPRPRYADYDGRRLPATYANFLIINGAVLVPTYDDPADEEALATLADCFPDRKIIGIHSLPVIQWYGSIHCMTMQLPLGVLS
ncbi:Agmatine deiminase [Aquicella siphonis]|uniref:Agmatine deiminase n=1 Tax=Aquicella siphonis TaxID=254247 RepID=A0A5E4PJB1_9COXI|nr:agmatine deiminase family protein [Aquicella siphonis]VVC77054.1 Agmatine deiminase [Aquicella siphonis]